MIDILKRIDELREKRGWTEHKMSKMAGLTQSTVSSWKLKGLMPSIQAIEKICNAFGITMSEFFAEEGQECMYLDVTDRQMLRAYHEMSDEKRKRFVQFLEEK